MISAATLRIFHVAYKAVPFVPAEKAKGLAEVAGKFPAIENGLGLKSGLIMPLFGPTRDVIDQLGLRDGNGPFESLPPNRFFPDSMPASKIWKVNSPLGYPVYLVENEKFSDLPSIYGHPNDLEIAFDFADAVLELLPRLGPAPNALMLHDWQTAAVAIKLAQRVKYFGDMFFSDTRTIGFVHDPNYQGRFKRDVFPQAKMGWEHQLPPWVEFWRDACMLKGLLYQTDLSLVRSSSLIAEMRQGRISDGFHGIVAERVDAGKLVAICETDDRWSPTRELTEPDAEAGVAREIMALRALIPFSFEGMEKAKQTHPNVKPYILSAIEALNCVSPFVSEAYPKLDPDARALIDGELAASRSGRFACITSQDELDRIINFLKIKPTCNIEEEMERAGLGEFLGEFYTGDLNRLLSVELDRAKSKKAELQEGAADNARLSIYEAMKRIGVHDHVLVLFRLLDGLNQAKDISEKALSDQMERLGISANPTDLWTLSLRFRDMSVNMIRPFLLGVLLHDVGNFVENKNHHVHGRDLIGQSPLRDAVLALVSENELEWIQTLVYYHLIFSTFVIDEDSKYNKILRLWSVAPDEEKRKSLIDAMVVLSVIDSQARAGIETVEQER
ncbi:MAG TPA: glycogen/starch synthase, partial [Candidatus Omnitrophota bacterium]|nr:glycogen/starch synthase [Candidatus Omnitrophota bacterium]